MKNQRLHEDSYQYHKNTIRLRIITNKSINMIIAIETQKTMRDLAQRVLNCFHQLSEQHAIIPHKRRDLNVSAIKIQSFYVSKEEIVGNLLKDYDQVQCIITKAKPKYPNYPKSVNNYVHQNKNNLSLNEKKSGIKNLQKTVKQKQSNNPTSFVPNQGIQKYKKKDLQNKRSNYDNERQKEIIKKETNQNILSNVQKKSKKQIKRQKKRQKLLEAQREQLDRPKNSQIEINQHKRRKQHTNMDKQNQLQNQQGKNSSQSHQQKQRFIIQRLKINEDLQIHKQTEQMFLNISKMGKGDELQANKKIQTKDRENNNKSKELIANQIEQVNGPSKQYNQQSIKNSLYNQLIKEQQGIKKNKQQKQLQPQPQHMSQVKKQIENQLARGLGKNKHNKQESKKKKNTTTSILQILSKANQDRQKKNKKKDKKNEKIQQTINDNNSTQKNGNNLSNNFKSNKNDVRQAAFKGAKNQKQSTPTNKIASPKVTFHNSPLMSPQIGGMSSPKRKISNPPLQKIQLQYNLQQNQDKQTKGQTDIKVDGKKVAQKQEMRATDTSQNGGTNEIKRELNMTFGPKVIVQQDSEVQSVHHSSKKQKQSTFYENPQVNQLNNKISKYKLQLFNLGSDSEDQ